MLSAPRALLVSLLASGALAFPPFGPGSGSHGYGSGSSSVGRAIYLQTNEADNSVVAIPISADGTLSGGHLVATGGQGSTIAVNGSASSPQTPDSLGSQSSVTVAGNFVFAVNAGSNTLSLFEASPGKDAGLRLIGESAKLPGEFANTVAVSQKHQLACVGFTGAKAGISCLPYSPQGFGHASSLHAFDLGQLTPPNSLLNLLGQTFFSADESYLYTTVRGDGGFFSAIPVKSFFGKSSDADGTVSLEGFKGALFDGVVVPGTNEVLVADPTYGADKITVDPATHEASLAQAIKIPGQKATCWIAYSKKTGSAYVDDAAHSRVLELDPATGSIIDELNFKNGPPGGFDLAVGGNYIYILYAGNGTVPGSVTVVDTKGKQKSLEQLQVFDLSHLGIKPTAQGMAVLQ